MGKGDRVDPEVDAWIAAIHATQDDFRPVGSGIVLDERRIMTCLHVVEGLAEPWVAFPKAQANAGFTRRRVERVVLPDGYDDVRDLAILVLAESVPPGVTAAPLRFPEPGKLIGKQWWAFGFPNFDPLGSTAGGQVGDALGYGWVRLYRASPDPVEVGFSGGGLWCARYGAVVAVVGQADGQPGGGRAITLSQADEWFPGQELRALANRQASSPADLARPAPEVAELARRLADLPDAPAPVSAPTPGIRRFRRKRGVFTCSVKVTLAAVSAAVVLVAAILVWLNSCSGTKPPLPTKSTQPSRSARPTPRQTSTAPIACVSGPTIELIGSSAFGPIAKAAARIYMQQCHVSINVIYGEFDGKNIDSAYGVTMVNTMVQSKPAQAGSVIAMYDGETSTLAPLLTPDPVGVLIFSVVAHNGLYHGSGISKGELRQLFLQGGEPGKVAVGRQGGSGSRYALLKFFGVPEPGPQVSSNNCPPPAGSAVCTEYSTAGLLGFVNGTPDAIGYAEVDQESNGHPAGYPDVSVIAIKGVAPTPENVRNGSYTFAQVENLYMPPHPSPLAKSFYQYLLQYVSSNQSDGLITCSGIPKSLKTNC
jgi:ABC-type phosphate transport system substrate-binding protein